jgi:hypothetical protein
MLSFPSKEHEIFDSFLAGTLAALAVVWFHFGNICLLGAIDEHPHHIPLAALLTSRRRYRPLLNTFCPRWVKSLNLPLYY